jgi:predicted Zn-dependent protease
MIIFSAKNNAFPKIFFAFIAAASFFLSGCASVGSYNTATGRRELIFIPTSEEVSMGQKIHQDLSRKYKLSTDKVKTERLVQIASRVAQVSDRQDYKYKFFLVDADELNAFTTPGGNIYFFTGLYDRLTSDDQIAAVLAHEIGHCAARHTIKKFQAALGYDLVGNIIFNQLNLGSGGNRLAAMGTDFAMSLVFSAYGRKDEYQADTLGVKYMFLAGYDVNAVIQTLRVLQKESKGGHPPVMLSTHPYLDDRIKAVEKEIVSVHSQYKTDL